MAHALLLIVYHILAHQRPYWELGATYLEQRDREQATRRYVEQLERLGHRVMLEPAAYGGIFNVAKIHTIGR